MYFTNVSHTTVKPKQKKRKREYHASDYFFLHYFVTKVLISKLFVRGYVTHNEENGLQHLRSTT